MYTDESLRTGTAITGMFRDYDYQLSETEYNSLSKYAKSIYEVKDKGQIVTPISNETIFVKNTSVFTLSTLTASLFTSEDYSYPINAFRDGQSLDTFFEGIAEYRGESWWSNLNK